MAIKASCTITLSCYRDTESVTRYYKLQSSAASSPTKPTENPPSGWTDAEPSYTSGSTNTLYFCDLTVFSDGTWAYSNISKSSSYEAAKEAYNKAINAQTTANAANAYVTNAKNNYGYQYKYTLTLNGDSSLYYPVVLRGGNQNVMREILITRSYSDKCPSDWEGHGTTHGISLLLKIKCNFGGWGGANYSWNIHDLEECYGNVFTSACLCMSSMGFAIFLRGGGTTGATYYMYSDQPLETTQMNGTSPQICYNSDLIGWSGGTVDNPTYSWNAPAPRTLSDSVKAEIASKKYIDVATSALTRVSAAETQISQNKEAIELRATKATVTELSNNLTNNYYNKSQVDSKISVEADKISSAVSRISTNETAISTLEQTADGLEVRLNSTDSDLANNYTKKTLPDTRNDNQTPEWYITNYPRQVITEFKYTSVMGLSGETYCTLETTVPWNNTSGGYPKQLAKVGNKEYWRIGTSTTAWGAWIDAYGTAKTRLKQLQTISASVVPD